MKKVIIVVSQLRVGGVAKALIELLRCIGGKYEISLLCFDHRGTFFEDIPVSVHIFDINKYLLMTERAASDLSEYDQVFKYLRGACSIWTKKFGKKLPAKYITKSVGTIEGEYDIAISFGHPMPEHMYCNITSEVTLECIKAKKKAIVIHCDFESYGGNCKYNRDLINRFDKVAAVSRSVGQTVAKCIPEASDKVVVLRNCHDFEKIREMAGIDPVQYRHEINIVSVARLSEEKGLVRCVPLIRKLHDAGYDVGWNLVGNGPLYKELKEEISNYAAEDYIVLEGEHANAYRYIKNANYLLVPSFHEAAPMVFDEAAALGVAVLTTKTLSAEEIIADQKLGMVCDVDNASVEKMLFEAVKKISTMNLEKHCYTATNEKAMQDFEELCND